jgi:hypothetical protein
MREKILGILVCTLMISSFVAGVSGNDLILKIRGIHPFDIEDGVISSTISVGKYEIKSTDVMGSEIFVEGFGRLLIPGKPDLPSKIFSIAIPPGAILKDFEFNSGESVVIDGNYYIKPVPIPILIGETEPEFYEQMQIEYNENYQQVYNSDDPYPSSTVELVGTGGYRKYNIVNFRVNPITYHPLSGTLIYHPEINIDISYTFPEGFTYDDVMVDNVDGLAEEIVLNYDQAKNWYTGGTIGRGAYDYVIITIESLTSSIDSLVDWEEAKGRNVNVVTTSWISSNYAGYDLAEKIRNFLRDKYPSEEWGIEDVCIIGHWEDVPIRTCWQFVSSYGPPTTDLYYAELSLPDSQSWDADGDHLWGENSDPIDFISEVNVGRIPWSDPSTVEDICNKTVAYEQTDDPDFKKNILLLGAFFWADTDNAVLMEYKTDDTLHPWMEDWTMTRMYEEGQSSYPMDYNLDYNNVKDVWSAGTYAFVDWAGHGSPTACYELYPSQPFVDTQTCNYLNDEYPAIIFADACSNSYTGSLNIGQAMLKQGGVGFLGATEVAFGKHAWDDPYDGSSQSLDYFFTTCVTSGNYTQGQAHQWSLYEMYSNNLWYYAKYEMFQWGALWGNPDLTMAPVVVSDPPETPGRPEGPTGGTTDEVLTFTATTTEPDGEPIKYGWDWDGDLEVDDWSDWYTSGEICTMSHAWTQAGTYNVSVKASDNHSSESNWSEPLIVTITKNQPPDRPTISGSRIIIGGLEYKYKFKATDPDGQDIEYKIDWDDGSGEDWMGPYSSGEEITLGHKWTEKGDYHIKAWTRDAAGAKSSQGTYKITVLFVIKSVVNQVPLYMQRSQSGSSH